MRRVTILVLALCFMICCGCNAGTAPASSPATSAETQPATTEPAATEPAETVPTETEPVTEPTEPQPIELTFSYPEGTCVNRITSEEGITIECGALNEFIRKSYGIALTVSPNGYLSPHGFEPQFEIESGKLKEIVLLGSRKEELKRLDEVNYVSEEYILELGYRYVLLIIESEGHEYSALFPIVVG